MVPLFAIGLGPFDLSGPDFLKFFVPLSLVAIVVSLILRFATRIGDRPLEGDKLTAAEAACLAKGPRAAVNVTVAQLLQDGQLETRKPASKIAGGPPKFSATIAEPPEDDEIALAIMTAAGKSPKTLHELDRAAEAEAAELVDDLKERGYLANDAEAFAVRIWPVAILLVVLLIGGIKMAVGVSRNRPIQLLILSCVPVVLAAFACGNRPRRTSAGTAALNDLKQLYSQTRRETPLSELPGSSVAMLAGLFGTAVLTDELFKEFKRGWRETSPQWGASDSGSGSGCSTSSCGGGSGCGGGGCGGCGGGGS
jgi:uncharacterized protein (TIGR04222 family)